ncbi:MAG: P4B major core protein [Homavirus sp.]|uniref:P4B major core protein n=1 Tax=Homavirus sp. TaxID=2487769 RepID=A0A3G5A4H2_9VIRU|nr:MAG: P4B major core protein [Homavirus sp.]
MADYKKNFPRDTTSDDHSRQGNQSLIKKEVENLMHRGKTDYSALQELRHKFKDEDLVNAIFDTFKDRLKFITKKAGKFKNLIYSKYAPKNLPYEELFRKAKRYAKKYELSDEEFNMFWNLSLTDRSVANDFASFPNTEMAKTLGYDAIALSSNKLNVKTSEVEIVNEIIRLHGQTKALHAQVVLQSLTYRDCAPEALNGTNDFKADKFNWYSYVHPVIAALFLPKIKLLDEHMLIANLGYIIKCKYENQPLLTKPDFELYWDLIIDPNERVCHINTPIKDLSNRFLLQTKLWDAVLNLRQGKYYNDRLNDFMLTIDNCRNNIYDAPDLTYVKDEGTILRRLLAAFSIRPTIVTTSRLYGLLGVASYGSTHPLSAAGITEVTTVPMVNLRLPISISTNNQVAVSLDDALTQPQWYIENKMIVPKSQSIMHSRDVLFFYVGRRFQTVNLTRLNTPYNFNALPMTVAGWEALNDRVVNFEYTMTLLNDIYELRSVVIVERSHTQKNLIVGSTAAIRIPRNLSQQMYDETVLLYDPQGAGEMFRTSGGNYERNHPITYIPDETPFAPGNVESFYKRASTRGTIFMYQKVTESDCLDQTGIIRFP